MIIESFIQKRKDISINITSSKIDAMRNRDITYLSSRYFDDKGRLGLASAMGNMKMEDLIDEAKANLSLGFKYDYQLPSGIKCHDSAIEPKLFDGDYLLGLANDLINSLNAISDRILISNKVQISEKSLHLKTDSGNDIYYDYTTLEGGLILKVKGSANLMDGQLPFLSPKQPNTDHIIQDAQKIFPALLMDEMDISQAEIPVALMDNALFSHFGRDFSGLEYNRGSSLFAGKLGEKIFSEKLNIKELYHHPVLNRFLPCDHEYCLHKDSFVLVEKGIMKNLLFDRKNAKKFEKQPTGHGYRSYLSNPEISILGELYPEPYSGDLLASTDELTLIPYISMGGDFLPNGDFSAPVQVGFLVKNGKIVGKCRPLTVKGNIFKLLGEEGLLGIYNDDLFNFSAHIPTIKCRMEIC